MFTNYSFHRISKMYKKIREWNRTSAEPSILPTAEELALRLSHGRQMASTINQTARPYRVNSTEDGPDAGLNSAEDGLPVVVNVGNRADNSLCSISTTPYAIQVDNTPVPEIIICVSSIVPVNISNFQETP